MAKRGNNEGSISRREDGRWMARITIGRDPQTGKLKRAYFYGKTRQEVHEQMTKALHDHARGTFVAPHKTTVGEWLDFWLYQLKRPKLRPTTFDTYEALIRLHIKPALEHIPLKDLRPEHLQRLYNEKAQAGRVHGAGGLHPKTVRQIHVLVHGALEQAVKHQHIARNVSELTERPRIVGREMHTLTLEQVATTLLPSIANDRLVAAVLLAFHSGLRRGELLGLRWRDVDLKAGRLHVRQHLVRTRGQGRVVLVFQEPKTPQSLRTIPLSTECITALKHHKAHQAEERLLLGQAYQDHGLVFCREDGLPLDPRRFADRFTRMLKHAGLPLIRLHDARHTFATHMLELRESPKTVQALLGHSRVAITLDTYSHVSLDLEERAVDRLGAAYRAATTPTAGE